MKQKNMIMSLTAVVLLCAIVVFNFTVFPNVLAKTPDKSEVKSIVVEPIPTTIIEKDAEAEVQPDINAISKKQAVENAIKKMETYDFGGLDFKELPCIAKYIPGIAPANNPLWVVVFKINDTAKYMDSMTPEAYLFFKEKNGKVVDSRGVEVEESYTDSEGNVFWLVESTTFMIMEVNAFSGDTGHANEMSYVNDNDESKSAVINMLIELYRESFDFD